MIQSDRILLLLGGNLGPVQKAGAYVVRRLGGNYRVERQSSWYQSPAWGFEGPSFLNSIVELSKVKDIEGLFQYCQEIEREFGRTRSGDGYMSRAMDIDILYDGWNVHQTKKLHIPHPEIPNRRFTLLPLCQYWPEWIHPELKLNQRELLDRCPDTSEVILIEE